MSEEQRYMLEDFFGTVELQRRAVSNGNQCRRVIRDKHGMVIEIGEWDGPYVLMEFLK
jgi:hypothetical protein